MLSNSFFFFILTFFEYLTNVFTSGHKRVANLFGQKQITTKNNPKRRPRNFIGRMVEMKQRLVLAHGQLEFTNCIFDSYLQNHIQSQQIIQPIVQLYNFIADIIAVAVYDRNCSLDILY